MSESLVLSFDFCSRVILVRYLKRKENGGETAGHMFKEVDWIKEDLRIC